MSTRLLSRLPTAGPPGGGVRSPAGGRGLAVRARPPPHALRTLPRADAMPARAALSAPRLPLSRSFRNFWKTSAPEPARFPAAPVRAPHAGPPLHPVGVPRCPAGPVGLSRAEASDAPSTSGRSGGAGAADVPGGWGPPARRCSAGTPPGGPAATSASRGPGRRCRSGKTHAGGWVARRRGPGARPAPAVCPRGFLPTPPPAAAGREQLVPPRNEGKGEAGTGTSLLRQPGS